MIYWFIKAEDKLTIDFFIPLNKAIHIQAIYCRGGNIMETVVIKKKKVFPFHSSMLSACANFYLKKKQDL